MKNDISRIGFGTSDIASLGKSISYQKAKKILSTALEYDIYTIDTSDAYGSGDAEKLIGKLIRGERGKFFIISKTGLPVSNLPSFLSPLNQIGKKLKTLSGFKKKFDKKYIVSSIENSLKRLKVEYLDAYLLHDLNKEDIIKYNDECFEALYLIKKKGLSRFIGVSTNDVEALDFINKKVEVDYIQTKMNFTEDLLFQNIKDNFKVIANSVLSQKIENNLKLKLSEFLEKSGVSKDELKIILFMYCVFKKKINCTLFRTKNLDHLKNIGDTYMHYKNSSLMFFDDLEKYINDKNI